MTKPLRVTVNLPPLGDGANTVLVLEWLAEVGATVREGDALVSVETDKVTAEVPSTAAGTLVAQLVAVGDEIGSGTPLALLESPT